ncbi:MAG: HAMP domain-containing histidine kinase [Candidatus Eremiobacteraeota bacterium]|nr:HAMP domain-containing histidine kinase [Candidatus Eremiobacteraeota bacterium]
MPDLGSLAEKLLSFARRRRALPLIYVEYSSEDRLTGPRARRRAAAYKQATSAAIKASIGSVLRKGDLVAAGAGGKWFVALLVARTGAARPQSSDPDLGAAAERLRRAVQVELAHLQRRSADGLAEGIAVRCGWNVLEPADDPLEALRHAIRGAAVVARVEERRSTVMAAVTHEIRTPLTAIIGFAERLHSTRLNASQKKRYLNIILDESKRLHRLAEGLIDVGSWTAGHLRLHTEPQSLAAIAGEACRALADHAAKKHVTIAVSGDAYAQVDHDRCLQIFINLLDNAVRYSPSGEVVDVILKRRGRECHAAVTDNGPGFVPSIRLAGGKPFAAARNGKVGLGLAIARLLVEAHSGTMSILKRRHGAMVSITFPAGNGRR